MAASSPSDVQNSSLSAPNSDRIELLMRSYGHGSLPLTEEQVRYCREALAMLTQKLDASGGRRKIDKEFDSLLSGRMQGDIFLARTTIGRLEVNQPKNRYLNVVPYNDTRVSLKVPLNGSGCKSSYINASYVVDSAHKSLPKYIATQGPLQNTIVDFWEMVVQHQCPVVVMLVALKDEYNKIVKCDNYFPIQTQESRVYGQFVVTNKSSKISESAVVLRLLEIEHSHQLDDPAPVPVLHLQYLEWPDHGTPASTLSVREIFKTLYRIPTNFGPFVVHCSAGIGRTGTFCTMDHTLRRILLGDLSAVDMESTVHHFRQQRFGMVETREQYTFCYMAVIAELQDLILKQAV